MIKSPKKTAPEEKRVKYYFANGRTAFLEGMKLLSINKKKQILLPAYIGISVKEGSGVLDPIQKLGAGYQFYKINEDFSVNKDNLTKQIRQKNIKAVLVIHYFGFPQPDFDFIIEACRKYNKYLIEDCAHAFNSYWKGKKLGTYGDFGFYSIHKFLPIRTGGILEINKNSDIDIKTNLKENISYSARTAFKQADIAKISRKRKENYEYAFKKTKDIKGIKALFQRLPEGVAPLNFPVVIEKDIRDKVYFYLRRKGVRVSSLYYKLIPPIKKNKYPVSHYISRHIFNLPIHQKITREKIDFMSETLSKALKNNEKSDF
jgi:dTDP-4-amino-4,6-dideoxygalactose transaminase